MESWSAEIIKNIDTQLTGVRDKDLRFFRIDEFKRNIKRVDEFSTKCAFCEKQKIEIKEIAKTIDEAVKVPGRSRRNYDRYISKLSKHMQKEHGFYAPYYFTYLRSFFGIIAGLLIGYFLTLVVDGDTVFLYSIGFVSGLFPGYLLGSIKDKKIRRTKKLM